MKNYYDILGVTESATQDEIKKAYRKLSKQYHPDVNSEGENKFKEITEAYETLGDESKRHHYNNTRNNPFNNMGGGFDFNNIFEQMMNGGRHQQKRAADKIINLEINPIESYFGVKKEFKIDYLNKCEPCNGNGGSIKICETCKGNGFVLKIFGTGLFRQQVQTTCPTCNGGGSVITNVCGGCLGHGVKKEQQTLQVSIPQNVDDGDFLRLQGKGDYDRNVKFRGDLIIKVNMVNNEFQKIGMDLIYNKEITPLNLLVDDEMLVKHPDGDLMIKIPSEVNTDKPLRIVGKGYNLINGRGNFFIKLNVVKNKDLSDDIKLKIKELLK